MLYRASEMVLDILKECTALIYRVKQSKKILLGLEISKMLHTCSNVLFVC